METTDAVNNKTEWTGVSEVINKTQNGLYRANATTGIMAVMLIVTFSIIYLNGDGGSPSLFSLAFGGATLVVLWIVTFLFGYVGSSWIPGYANPLITRNTNIQPGIFWRPQSLPNLKDMITGRLAVSAEGISGIVLSPWQNILSVRAKDSQNIELLRQERFFGLPTGKRKVILNFSNSEEATHFSEMVRKYISH